MSAFVIVDSAGAELATTDSFEDGLAMVRTRPTAMRILRRSDGAELAHRWMPKSLYLARLRGAA